MVEGAREFDPHKPWPTSFGRGRRTILLIVAVTVFQAWTNAFELIVPPAPMFLAWLVGFVVFAVLTYHIEGYFERRGRFLS